MSRMTDSDESALDALLAVAALLVVIAAIGVML